MAVSFGPNWGENYRNMEGVQNIIVRDDGSGQVLPMIGDENGLLVKFGGAGGTLGVQDAPYTQTTDRANVTVTTAGTPQQLPSFACSAVLLVTPLPTPVTDPAILMYWGFSSAGAKKPLQSGGHVLVPVANSNQIWVDAAVSGSFILFSTVGPA